MKLRFNRDVGVDVQKKSDDELWWKTYRKWDEILVENISDSMDSRTVHITTYDKDLLLFVPKDSFEICQ